MSDEMAIKEWWGRVKYNNSWCFSIVGTRWGELHDDARAGLREIYNLLSCADDKPTTLEDITEVKEPSFHEELIALINKHSKEAISNTPDFVLAGLMQDCLGAYERAVIMRDLHSHRFSGSAKVTDRKRP